MGDLPLIDDAILSCLFQPAYMTFDLCVNLESVSNAFFQKAHQFYQRLAYFDFKDHLAKEGQGKWASKISKRCLNVRKIENLQVNKESFESDVLNFQFISKMPNVSIVCANFKHVSAVILLVLADMGNLSRLEVSTCAIKNDTQSFRDTIQIKKIDVASLKCDSLLFVDFCNPDHLSVLNLDCVHAKADEYVSTLKRLRNLRELSLELYQPESIECVLRLVTFVAQVPQIQQFSLGLVFHCRKLKQDVLNLVSHRKVRKCLHRLHMYNMSGGQPAAIESCLGKLTQLRLLTLQLGVPCESENFLPMLPNLACFKTVSLAYVQSHTDVKVSYERWVVRAILCFKGHT